MNNFDSNEEFYFVRDDSTNNRIDQNSEYGDDEYEDSEFAFMTVKDSELSSSSADEIFENGKIRPVYPVFNRVEKENGFGISKAPPPRIRHQLRKLFNEERESAITTSSNSSSSSEADELDGLPPETYCVWRTNDSACKKSNSTGGSNSKIRWKFKDMLVLPRSHSDGRSSKGNFVFSNLSGRKSTVEVKEETMVGSGVKAVPLMPPRWREEKRRSYLPYRQDLLGFFGNS